MASQRTLLDVILGRNRNPQNGYAGYFFNSGNSQSTASGHEITPENAMRNATVQACVNVIAQGVGQLPWAVWRGDEMQDSHMISPILRKPNSFQTQYEFKSAVIRDILVYGNSFTKVVRSPNGRVLELIPMDPSDMSVAANSFGIPVYEHDEYGQMTANEVIHIRDVCGHDVEGQSRVLLAAERVGALNAADQLIAETFRNGVSVNYSVEMDASLDDVSREKLYAQLKNSFGQGGSRRGGIAVLEGGKMTALKGTTPADADLRELRIHLINEIAALFRVPPHLVGGTGDEKYNNVTAKMASMYRDTYAPLLANIEQAFSNNLLNNQHDLRFDVGSLTKGDLASQVTIATQAVMGMIMTPNEGREFIGLPPLEGEGMDEISTQQQQQQAQAEMAEAQEDRRGEGSDQGNLGDSPE